MTFLYQEMLKICEHVCFFETNRLFELSSSTIFGNQEHCCSHVYFFSVAQSQTVSRKVMTLHLLVDNGNEYVDYDDAKKLMVMKRGRC